MIKYKTSEYTFGDVVYLRTDPKQLPHILVRVALQSSYKEEDMAVPKFIISYMGDECEVWDFEVTKEPGPIREDEAKE